MDVSKAIRTRRSVRRYAQLPVERDEILRLIDAATWAPSAGNRQPWRFVCIEEVDTKRSLVAAALGQSFVAAAPWVICVIALVEQSAARYGERGRSLYALQDTAAAIQNVLLEAHAVGLGTCWVGAFDERAVAEVLSLSRSERPVALITVGHPAHHPTAPPRRSPSAVVSFGESDDTHGPID